MIVSFDCLFVVVVVVIVDVGVCALTLHTTYTRPNITLSSNRKWNEY